MAGPQQKRRARTRALEFLFGLEFTQYDWKAELEKFWTTFESKPDVREYAERLVLGVHEHRDALDDAIKDALKNWSWDRVDRAERNILRIALYEMIHLEDVPAKVAINEAIELTKIYGSDDSPKFVNGVLDRVKRKIEDASPASS